MQLHRTLLNNWYKYISWIFWVIFIVLCLFANSPDSFNLNFQTKKTLSFLFPQGWGFFTKDPRDAMVDAYEVRENGEFQLLSINNFSLANSFGLSRNNRRVGYEISLLLKPLSKKNWEQSQGVYSGRAPDTLQIVTIEENLYAFEFGKEYVFHQYKPIPFAWAGMQQEINRPYSIIRFKIAKDE